MNLLDQLQQLNPAPDERPAEAICSRKACRLPAAWQLLWNNPKIHTPDRRKIWVACADHRDWLEDYLQTRGLWKETLPLAGSHPEGNPSQGTASGGSSPADSTTAESTTAESATGESTTADNTTGQSAAADSATAENSTGGNSD